MTNEEMIQKLKENLARFGSLNNEMQGKMNSVGKGNLLYLNNNGTWVPPQNDGSRCYNELIYRLRPDYTEEPDVIELEIIQTDDGFVINDPNEYGVKYFYTNAPALCPKEGYRFAGYKYENGTNSVLPVLSETTVNVKTMIAIEDSTVIFPTHAVYKKTLKS